MSETAHLLSKSRYLTGSHCQKQLWLSVHSPELGSPSPQSHQAKAGIEIGDFARSYFGAYELIPDSIDQIAQAKQTGVWMADPNVQVIAEASFIFEQTFCRVDLLRRVSAGWEIIEVKSAKGSDTNGPIKVEDGHLQDISFQYRVLSNLGITIKAAKIMRTNGEYVGTGSQPIHSEFLVLHDVTELVLAEQESTQKGIETLLDVVNASETPAREIGAHCLAPQVCPFRNHCWSGMPSPNVYDLPRIRKATTAAELHRQGIVSFEDIQADPQALGKGALADRHRLIVNLALEHDKTPRYSISKIRDFLDQIKWPVYFLDFESFNLGVPKFIGTKSHIEVPFQYSLHIQDAPNSSELQHRELLVIDEADPRRKIAEGLVRDIPVDVTVLAWNKTFEQSRIKEMEQSFPDLGEHLAAIRNNIIDLGDPFKAMDYYDAAFNGSWSIKNVLPALFPNDDALNYSNLDLVHHGGEASEQYLRLRDPDVILDASEHERVVKAMLEYCKLDTFATVKILDFLVELTQE